MSPHQNDAVMRRHLAQWQGSGQSQRAYCKEHGLKPHVFSYYKKKLNSGMASTDAGQLVSVQLTPELTSSYSKATAERDSILVSHANGFSLMINDRTELSALKPLLELVRSIA